MSKNLSIGKIVAGVFLAQLLAFTLCYVIVWFTAPYLVRYTIEALGGLFR